MPWSCFVCAASSSASQRPVFCWSCGCLGSWRLPVERRITDYLRSSIAARSAASIVADSYEVLTCPETGLTWARPTWFLLYGAPGSGKSTLAFSMAVANSPETGVLVYASEEVPGPSLARKLVVAGAGRRRDVMVTTSGDLTDLIVAAQNRNTIVLDSLSAASFLQPGDVQSLVEAGAPLVITTLHLTKGGQAKGTSSWCHDADVVMRCEPGGIWLTEKNRHGESGVAGLIRGVASDVPGSEPGVHP